MHASWTGPGWHNALAAGFSPIGIQLITFGGRGVRRPTCAPSTPLSSAHAHSAAELPCAALRREGGRQRVFSPPAPRIAPKMTCRHQTPHRDATMRMGHLRSETGPQHPASPDHEQHTSNPSETCSVRSELFDEHEHGNRRYPQQVHHPSHEEQKHEHPATAHAVQTMSQAHGERPSRALAPMASEKASGDRQCVRHAALSGSH